MKLTAADLYDSDNSRSSMWWTICDKKDSCIYVAISGVFTSKANAQAFIDSNAPFAGCIPCVFIAVGLDESEWIG